MVAVAVALGYFGLFARRPRAPIDAIPGDSFLVATVNGEALRASPFRGPFVSLVDGRLRLPSGCPLKASERIDEAALSIPKGERSELAVAISGHATGDELATCRDVFPGSSTKTRAGSFELTGDPAGVRVGLSTRGPLIIGLGSWPEALANVADGTAPGLGSASPHATLRASLTARLAFPPALLVTVVPPKSLREDLRAFLGGDGAAKAASLLQIDAIGVAMSPGEKGKDAELVFEAHCETEAACLDAREFLMARRFDLSQKLGARLAGFGRLLDAFAAEAKGSRVFASTHDSADAVARSLEGVVTRYLRPDEPPSPSARPPVPPRAPDELLTPRSKSDNARDGGGI